MERHIMKYSKNVTETHPLSCLHKDCLLSLSEYPIHSEYIFIFKENVKNQARNHFNRLFTAKNTSCIIMTEEEFYHHFFV